MIQIDYTKLLRNKKLALIAVAAVFLVAIVVVASSQRSSEGRLVNSDDCNISEKFDIEFGRLEYFPGNETAVLEINATENVTSEYLKNLSLHGIGGEPYNTGPPVIRVNNRTSESGLIAVAGDDPRAAVADFPLQPMNITILEVDGDDDGDGYPGLEPGEQMHLMYAQSKVAIEGYCRYSHNRPLFSLKANDSVVDWKSWPPYTKGYLWKYDHIGDEELEQMSPERRERLSYDR